MQFIVLNHAIILYTALPSDFKLTIHRLVLKNAFIDSLALLVLSRVPLPITESTFEPAFTTLQHVLYLSIGHFSFFKKSFVDCLAVGEVKSSLSMPLVHVVHLTIVSGSITVCDVLYDPI